ncbi:DUF4345 family protein [Vibrio hangzhouensis]|uniref:DUF4345 domain-containing protein n=1 Tax=Vibrio hangzhouensis TaxID=462991 RepID=A0A1H5V661_9VIBR|nr:DUF4345 family protein [Vibrio hangzhouensis]MBY6196118.1 DUF4345 family protein [Vibrio hangzhouensis]SEF82700.1 protein of unknown function [Vibrio hangzhouensis]
MFQAKLMVWISALVFFGYGFLFSLSPNTLFERVTESALFSYSASIDVRATYGGMTLAIGIILALLVIKQDTLKLSVIAATLLAGLMAVTRMMGIVAESQPNDTMVFYLGTEVFFSLWGLFILWKFPKRRMYFK